MPAVVQHLAGLVDALDVASAGEMRVALDTANAGRPGQLRRARARPTTSCAGRSPRGSSSRSSRNRDRPARRRSASELGRHARASRDPGQSRLRGQGLRHADGRRSAAVRRRRRAGARAAGRLAEPRTSTCSASTSSPARRTCTPTIICRGAGARPSTSSLELAEHAPQAPLRYVNLGGGFGIPYFDKDAPLDLGAVGEHLGDAAAPSGSGRSCPRRGS